MDIVERLRKYDINCHCFENHQLTICEAANEIERLREALNFYANEKNYDLVLRTHFSLGEYEYSLIQDDNGTIARSVLTK